MRRRTTRQYGWTEAQLAALSLWPELSDEEIGQRIGKKRQTVTSFRTRLQNGEAGRRVKERTQHPDQVMYGRPTPEMLAERDAVLSRPMTLNMRWLGDPPVGRRAIDRIHGHV